MQSVVDWPTPTCLREVLQFLGLTNFFIKFVRGYANLTKPLVDLSKHEMTTIPHHDLRSVVIEINQPANVLYLGSWRWNAVYQPGCNTDT